jgi:hypothetical protein
VSLFETEIESVVARLVPTPSSVCPGSSSRGGLVYDYELEQHILAVVVPSLREYLVVSCRRGRVV